MWGGKGVSVWGPLIHTPHSSAEDTAAGPHWSLSPTVWEARLRCDTNRWWQRSAEEPDREQGQWASQPSEDQSLPAPLPKEPQALMGHHILWGTKITNAHAQEIKINIWHTHVSSVISRTLLQEQHHRSNPGPSAQLSHGWPAHPYLCLCSEWWRSLWHVRWNQGWRGCCPGGWLSSVCLHSWLWAYRHWTALVEL